MESRPPRDARRRHARRRHGGAALRAVRPVRRLERPDRPARVSSAAALGAPSSTRRMAVGMASSTSAAPIGAPSAAIRPASPCRNAAAAAADLAGSTPCASIAPARPDSTSPEPAVASHRVPVGLTKTASPASGVAITVVEPLSSTVTPSSAAARRDRREPVRLDVGVVRVQQPGELARVRRDQRRRPRWPGQQVLAPGQHREAVGIDEHGQRLRQYSGEQRRSIVIGAEPGPGDPRLYAPSGLDCGRSGRLGRVRRIGHSDDGFRPVLHGRHRRRPWPRRA